MRWTELRLGSLSGRGSFLRSFDWRVDGPRGAKDVVGSVLFSLSTDATQAGSPVPSPTASVSRGRCDSSSDMTQIAGVEAQADAPSRYAARGESSYMIFSMASRRRTCLAERRLGSGSRWWTQDVGVRRVTSCGGMFRSDAAHADSEARDGVSCRALQFGVSRAPAQHQGRMLEAAADVLIPRGMRGPSREPASAHPSCSAQPGAEGCANATRAPPLRASQAKRLRSAQDPRTAAGGLRSLFVSTPFHPVPGRRLTFRTARDHTRARSTTCAPGSDKCAPGSALSSRQTGRLLTATRTVTPRPRPSVHRHRRHPARRFTKPCLRAPSLRSLRPRRQTALPGHTLPLTLFLSGPKVCHVLGGERLRKLVLADFTPGSTGSTGFTRPRTT